ncbi:MAG: transposase [Halopseudomonas aestusnigri]
MPKKSRTRRVFSDDFKRQVVAEAIQSKASWSRVARKYDLNTNLLHRWRRDLGDLTFLPIEVDASSAQVVSAEPHKVVDCAELPKDRRVTIGDTSLEINLPCGTQLRCGKNMGLEALSQALNILRPQT